MTALCRLLRLMVAAPLAILADAIMPSPDATPVQNPAEPPQPPGLGDDAEAWVTSLVWHHGIDERCNFVDCYPCWMAGTEASDG